MQNVLSAILASWQKQHPMLAHEKLISGVRIEWGKCRKERTTKDGWLKNITVWAQIHQYMELLQSKITPWLRFKLCDIVQLTIVNLTAFRSHSGTRALKLNRPKIKYKICSTEHWHLFWSLSIDFFCFDELLLYNASLRGRQGKAGTDNS